MLTLSNIDTWGLVYWGLVTPFLSTVLFRKDFQICDLLPINALKVVACGGNVVLTYIVIFWTTGYVSRMRGALDMIVAIASAIQFLRDGRWRRIRQLLGPVVVSGVTWKAYNSDGNVFLRTLAAWSISLGSLVYRPDNLALETLLHLPRPPRRRTLHVLFNCLGLVIALGLGTDNALDGLKSNQAAKGSR